MARVAPSRSRARLVSPGGESQDRAYSKYKATMAKFRDQDAAERIRRDVAVLITAIEREAARWMGNSEGMPEDVVFAILKEEEAGEFRMVMPPTSESA